MARHHCQYLHDHHYHSHLHGHLMFFLLLLIGCTNDVLGIQPIYIGDHLKGPGFGGGGSPMITTTMIGFADFTATKDNTVIHYRPSASSSAPAVATTSGGSSSVSQVVRIVVNTVVSSEENKKKGGPDPPRKVNEIRPTAAQAFHVTSTVSPPSGPIQKLNGLGISSGLSTSRPEKRKVDHSGFIFQDDRVVGHNKELYGDSAVIVEPSALQGHADSHQQDSGEVHVRIAEHDQERGVVIVNNNEHQHVSARAASTSSSVTSASGPSLPTGLVTMMGGTVVQNGQTTVHETRVIGTYIDGTYAQILQSTSKIFENKIEAPKIKFTIQPSGVSSSDNVVVTPTVISTAPITTTSNSPSSSSLNPTPASSKKSVGWPTLKSRPTYSGIVRKSNKPSSSTADDSKSRLSRELSPTSTIKTTKPTSTRSRGGKNLFSSLAAQRSRLASLQRASRKSPTNDIQLKTVTPSVTSSSISETITPSAVIKESNDANKESKSGSKQKSSSSSRGGGNRKSRSRSTIRGKSSNTRNRNSADRNAIKPTRSSISRLTYTPNPSKFYPRRRSRLTKSERSNTVVDSNGTNGGNETATSSNGSGESMEARTIEMTSSTSEISQPMTTITTELTQYYGPEGSEKSLVFTTTFERPISAESTAMSGESESQEGDSEEGVASNEPSSIIAISTSVSTKVSESSKLETSQESIEKSIVETRVTATPPLSDEVVKEVTSSMTPPVPLSTITETFTTTETVERASLLPIYDGKSTAYYTLTQSYFVTKIVHALKTMPPKELLPFVIPSGDGRLPSSSKNEVGSDLNAAESEAQEDSIFPNSKSEEDDPLLNNSDILSFLNITDGNNDVDNKKADRREDGQSNGGSSTESTSSETPSPTSIAPPMTPPGFGGHPFFNPYLNPLAYLGMGVPYGAERIITTSRPVYTTETIYGTKVLPIWDGLKTSFRTTKAPSTTVVKTSYETYTTQVAGQNPLPYPNNPFPQPVQTITSSTTVITTETLTQTQVLKLMYDGYKTSYRTLLSTTETVKTLTTQTTTTIPYGAFPFFG